jgi:deoxyribonuclease IV
VSPTPAGGPAALIGAHVSVAGGLHRAIATAAGLGAEVIQVFVANPRGWAAPAVDPAADAAFAASCPVPVFVHAPYLINFGSPSPATRERSAAALRFSRARAAAIGARGVVVHAGSAVLGHRRSDALALVRSGLLPVLDAGPDAPPVLIEPTAGGGGALASDADSLADYLDRLGRDERVGVCLDTCHMHAAGHDLSTPTTFARALRAYARAAGPGGLGLVHVNDSRDPAGSCRDRHAALGRGTIGLAALGALFTTPASRRLPMVVETADVDHAADIAALKVLRASARPVARRRSVARLG